MKAVELNIKDLNKEKEELGPLTQPELSYGFEKIAPFWPLKNLIAINPLQGMEDHPIEEALKMSALYFQKETLPELMEAVNRETIKWLQTYCDEGQATIPLPFRKKGLYTAFRKLAVYDSRLHGLDEKKKKWLERLPHDPKEAIDHCLNRLGIIETKRHQFVTLLITTLPGWASYIKYITEWGGVDSFHDHPLTQSDYLAMRCIIISVLWPKAKDLLFWHTEAQEAYKSKESPLEEIQKKEMAYRLPLLHKFAGQDLPSSRTPEAQLVFCIDVRSEPFRKALEATDNYETFGFAGFFGISAQIINTVTNESFSSCPVLISPQYKIKEYPRMPHDSENARRGYERLTGMKKLYQSIKYTFTTPFALVESLGILSGVWMGLRSFTPHFAYKLKKAALRAIQNSIALEPSLQSIPIEDQVGCAEDALRMMGLAQHFAPLIVFCGHGGRTENNAYGSALDCGACGGRPGGSNAQILAAILNRLEVRIQLNQKGISIPDATTFLAAEHNTTTDEVILYGDQQSQQIEKLKKNLDMARRANCIKRAGQMDKKSRKGNPRKLLRLRSEDWAQVRPEWGLARNAAFIVAPRGLSASMNLEGRCFLHSYDYKGDPDGRFLATILTAPMVVAQWINAQYFFSTLDNVAYGSGSKITKNITGKFGIMQGNASDLMTGLPLQSVYRSDKEAYHELQRLMTVVYAPRELIDSIIRSQQILKKLFGNGWVQLVCIEPDTKKIHFLNRELTWQSGH